MSAWEPGAAVRYPELAGRVAVVTGGSHGLGADVARAFAAQGMPVLVCARDGDAIERVAASIRADGGVALAEPADVVERADVERVRARAEAELGPVFALAPFAGGDRSPGPLLEQGEAGWRETLDANLTATFLALRVFLPGMVERGAGSVVTMASAAARRQTPASAAYAAAKAAIVTLTRYAAEEVGPAGVRVNCVSPSIVMTETQRAKMSDEDVERAIAATPLGRLGVPRDVSEATLFLVSDAASWLTGVTLDVAGGRVMA